jgi:threonine/homoserine/homoserine lactone efflux protein
VLPTTHLPTFAVTAFVLIAVPGPSVLFTVSRAIALGRVAGVATVAGNTLGAFVQVVPVALGIGPLVERSVTLFTIMKLAGAAGTDQRHQRPGDDRYRRAARAHRP